MALTKVTRTGITDNSINAAKIEDGTIVDADITPGTITNAKLAGSIANAKLANSSITINGAAISLGGSVSAGSIAWQSVVVSDGSTVTTMVADRGYFVNNTSAAGIVKLPASASAGDTIAIKDYAGNFATNKLTIQRNSHNIQGVANDSLIQTNRASVQLVYIDATKGWLFTNESNVAALENKGYTSATGGTVTTSGDFKIHTFTGDGNFVVSSAGFGPAQLTKVDYLVVAGGGGGGTADGPGSSGPPGSHSAGGGGGAGGYRESKDTDISSPHTASPTAASTGVTIATQTYPITVGGGGGGSSNGSNSVFSTITSAGGGRGAGSPNQPAASDGGSGGGGGDGPARFTKGSGNTPPVSPSQGNDGGQPGSVANAGGGGAAGGAGGGTSFGMGANGGCGVTSCITASPVARAGGGGGGTASGSWGGGNSPCGSGGSGGAPTTNPGSNPSSVTSGAANRGGGGGGGYISRCSGSSGSGGKGIVVIRYKYQN
jgi:hypothetical protein